MISADKTQEIPLFQGIEPEILEKLVPLLEIRDFADGAYIFHRGDPGDSLFIIARGGAAVTLTNDEGHEYTLAALKEGDIFGEMALLSGEPRSANVKSLGELLAIEINQTAFSEMVRILPEFNNHLLRLLTSRLGITTTKRQADYQESKEIIANILCHQQPLDVAHFPGATKWAKQINETIQRLAKSDQHVLIKGEAGTGKSLIGNLIHHGRGGQDRPFLHLNCADTPPVLRQPPGKPMDWGDDLLKEAAQEAALFGHEAGASIYAKGTRRGFLELADGGTLLLDNLEFLALSIQERLISFLRTNSFNRIGEERILQSSARIIATTSGKSGGAVEAGKILPELLELLSGEVIELTPLRERKKDIPAVAGHFLAAANRNEHKNIKGFSDEAMNALVDYAWPSNMIELRQVVGRAVAICGSDTIGEEHIFLEISAFTSSGKVNLMRNALLSRLTHNRHVPSALLFMTVPFFLLLIACSLFGPARNNPAGILAWGILWPGLIVSIAITARSWCGYCPMSAISNILVAGRKRFLRTPVFMKRQGIWIAIAGFMLIIWVEHATHMARNASATGILFLTILGSSILTTQVFGRRVWCQYICPLGQMTGHFSILSMIELRSNSNVCLSQCQTHDCIKKGCPMGLHPSAARTRHDCILCLSCVKNCQHKAVRIDAMPPWRKVLATEKWELSRAFFSIVVTASILAVKLPDWIAAHVSLLRHAPPVHPVQTPLAQTATYFATIAGYLTLACLASAARSRKLWIRNFIHAGYAYLPIAFLGLFNVYFREFVSDGHKLLPLTVSLLGLSHIIRPEWITPNLATLKALFPLVTLTGAAFSLHLLKAIKHERGISIAAWHFHRVILVATAILFFIIL